MVLCWLCSYANLYIPGERKNPAEYYNLCHWNSSATVLSRLSWFVFSISPMIWLKKNQLDIVENCVIQLIFQSGGLKVWNMKQQNNKKKCLMHAITSIKLLLNHTSEAFYPLRPHKLFSRTISMRVSYYRSRGIYFCLSFQQTQENTLHMEELVRIPWTQGIKGDFNTKLNYIPSSEYRLILSLIQNLTQAGCTICM